MGYSKSRETLEKMLPQLDQIASGNPCVWVVDGDPHAFAYKVREALYIAKLYRLDYPSLAQAASIFTIKIERPNRVLAVRAEETHAYITVTGEDHEVIEVRKENLRKQRPQTATTVMQAWLENPSAKQIHFPEAKLSRADLEALYQWSTKRELIFFNAGDGLTIQPYEKDLAEFAWNPED
jgi:hypothetical protein